MRLLFNIDEVATIKKYAENALKKGSGEMTITLVIPKENVEYITKATEGYDLVLVWPGIPQLKEN